MLIDKETAYKALKQKEEMYGLSFTAEAFGKAARIVDQMHGIDIVRCGECKYMLPCGRCTMFADDKIRPSVSDFCSHGERGEAR